MRELGTILRLPGKGGMVLIQPYDDTYTEAHYSVWDPVTGKAMMNEKHLYAEMMSMAEVYSYPPARPWNPNITVSGRHVFFHSWFPGNYGHFLVDHLPSIAYLREKVPENTRFLLHFDEMSQKFMKWFDIDFYNRIEWIHIGQLVQVVDGDLMVFNRDHKNTHSTLISSFHSWSDSRASSLIPGGRKKQPDTIILHSRTGKNTLHGRVVEVEHEKKIIRLIRHAMKKYHRTEKLVIFNGYINDTSMTYQQQYELMQSASVFIGPHGTGTCNAVFMAGYAGPSCSHRPKLLEFSCGHNNPNCTVQDGGIFRNAYFQMATAPWLDYHQVNYDANKSTSNFTFIHLHSFKKALKEVFRG